MLQRSVKVPAECFGWSLTPGRGGLFGLFNDQNQLEMDLERAGRIIHHRQWLYHCLQLQKRLMFGRANFDLLRLHVLRRA
ncbi:MAG TPA: hypothetical protein VIZ18_13080 [Ktedonobacteraceae bacterium]